MFGMENGEDFKKKKKKLGMGDEEINGIRPLYDSIIRKESLGYWRITENKGKCLVYAYCI